MLLEVVSVMVFFSVVRPGACGRSFGRSAAVEGFSSQRLSAAVVRFFTLFLVPWLPSLRGAGTAVPEGCGNDRGALLTEA